MDDMYAAQEASTVTRRSVANVLRVMRGARFADKRIRGEWFSDCPEIRDFVNTLPEEHVTMASNAA